MICWRYKSIATDLDKNSVDTSHDLSDEVFSEFIRFNLGFHRDRQLVDDISQLIFYIDRIFSHNSGFQDEAPSNNDLEQEHMVAVQRAKEFSIRSTQLFHLLSQNIGRCGVEHIVNIHLFGFGVKDFEMNMLLSTCTKQLLSGMWCPVEFKKQK